MKNVKTLIDTYSYLLKILLKNAPAIVILVFGLSILFGLLAPFSVFVNSNLFNLGLKVAQGEVGFGELIPFLVLFVVAALAPGLIDLFVDGFAEARSQLVLRSAFRGEMLQKLKKDHEPLVPGPDDSPFAFKTCCRLVVGEVY